MNMIEVFEEHVVKPTEKSLQRTLGKLSHDGSIRRRIRVLADISRDYNRFKNILNSDTSFSIETRNKWSAKRDELNQKRLQMHNDLIDEGFKGSWIETIIDNEVKVLVELLDNVRKNSYLKFFGKEDISDVDIYDDRWEFIEQQMKQAIDNYINDSK